MQVQLANASFLKRTNRGTGNMDCWDRMCTRSCMMSNAARRILAFQSPVSWYRGQSTWCCYHLPGHPGCPQLQQKNALKISKHSGIKRWRSNELRKDNNAKQWPEKQQKSEVSVGGCFFFFQFQSLAFTCWMGARCLTVRRLRRKKNDVQDLNTHTETWILTCRSPNSPICLKAIHTLKKQILLNPVRSQ